MNEHGDMRALGIDDDEESRKTLKRLNRYGVSCTAIAPPKADAFPEEILARIKRDQIDVVLLDFRLDDQAPPGDKPVSYRGATLAAAIKEKQPIPIVLVTTEEKLREHVSGNPRIRDLFDHTLLKSQIGGRPKERKSAATQITDLGIGFRRIRDALDRPVSNERLRQRVCKLLGINRNELSQLEENLQAPVPTDALEFSGWLLQGLLIFPGPLLAAGEASARLGLTPGSFDKEKVRSWTDSSRYQGVFAELHPCWWEGRLLAQLREAAGDASFGEAKDRTAAIAKACGEKRLTAASCSYCQGGLVQRCCYVCQKAVDNTHYLAAHVDDRPTWSLRAAVCFQCIKSGRDEGIQAIRYSPGSGPLLAELKGTE